MQKKLWKNLDVIDNMLIQDIDKFLKEEISEIFLLSKDKCNLSFSDFIESSDDHIVAEFYGGLNGSGKWTDYITIISCLIKTINLKYDCWLVSLNNDCLDDVFTLKLGIKYKYTE